MLAVAIAWGSSYVFAKQSVALYPVLGFLAIRFCMTFMLLLPSLRNVATQDGRNALKAGLPLGLILLAIFMAETHGVMLTRASNAAFLISLCIMFTPFTEWLLLRRRPETRIFIAAAISLFGAGLLTLASVWILILATGSSCWPPCCAPSWCA